MKKAKNGKSSFENLASIIDSLTQDQFETIVKRTSGLTTSFLKQFQGLLKKETSETISEQMFNNIRTKSFSKLVENTYNRTLSLTAELWRQNQAKEWQIDLQKKIDEVEGLCFIKQYELAAVHLANIEKRYFANTDKIKRFYDDWTIISRIANLKFYLAQSSCSSGILEPDNFDVLIHGLFMIGYNLRKDHELPLWSLQKSKAAYHNYIIDYLIKEDHYEEIITELERQIKRRSIDLDKPVLNELTEFVKWEIAIAHYKIGNFDKVEHIAYDLAQKQTIPSVIARQQFLELLQKHKIEKNDNQNLKEISTLGALNLYTENHTKDLAIRLELNQLLIKFLDLDFKGCNEDIEVIKKNRNELLRSNKVIYRDILFLELLSKYMNDPSEILDNIYRDLLKFCEPNTFEYHARKHLQKFTKIPFFLGKKSFAAENQKEYEELKKLSFNGEPIHALILSFLNGNFSNKR
ncbi:hypothetical protein [Roseivirga pacifica]|uniref:hypothetical protein n=1 Tax=Roseivirga pacifica TaxID=1267423 RepID=UPI003BA8D9B0